jgi:DNA repair exonuclease SbcCD ATPase subunit
MSREDFCYLLARVQELQRENVELKRSVGELRTQLDEIQNRVADHERYLTEGGVVAKVEGF